MIGLSYHELKKLNPCREDMRDTIDRLGGARKWGARKITAAEAVAAGISLSNLIWIASAVARTDSDVERRLRLWMADCAAHVLGIYEGEFPTNMRPRNAIKAARSSANGKINNAASDATWDAIRASRSAASTAAAAVRAAARDTSSVAASNAARAAEKQWQLDRLVTWLSDPEPRVYPLPRKQRGTR